MKNVNKYKDAEFITVGDGPIRIQIVKAANLNMGHLIYVMKKLFEIECETNIIKTLAEEKSTSK